MRITCLESGKGVCLCTSTGKVGIRHLEKRGYCAIHMGFLRYISGSMASLGGGGGVGGGCRSGEGVGVNMNNISIRMSMEQE